MYNRILKLPLEGKSSIFLLGPRGTGKTSFIKQHMPTALYIDLLDFSTYSTLAARPDRLENLIPPNFDEWIVIDEIQRVSELLNEVHRLIESRKLRFFLTTSSMLPLRKKGINLLAGRALTYTMHPLVIQEIGEMFNIKHAVQNGLLPAVIGHENPKRYLATYTQTYVREEVLEEGLTRNRGAFTRFLEAASFSQGQTVNLSEIARELALNRHMVAGYFDILTDLLLAIKLSPFTYRAKRKMIAHEKFYFFDAGGYRILRPIGPLDTPQEAEGAALETLFLQSLRAINDYFDLGYTIYFWRTATGTAVDFVLYGPRGLHAFEIKRSSLITSKSLKGLKEFAKDYPEAQLHLLYFGKQREYHNTIRAIPFVEALKDLPQLLS